MIGKIDINCDLGEGICNEPIIMPLLSSCNIACGEHAGDKETMQSTIALALKYNTKIGAHPSFPDRENFGRTEMNLPSGELQSIISEQINRLNKLVKEQKGQLHHVKPHGALYNMAFVNEDIAEAIIKSMSSQDEVLFLYVPYGSVIERKAVEKNIPVKYEAFADRNYNDDLTLVSRKLQNALLKDKNEIFDHIFCMIKDQKVKTISGKWIKIMANTLCIHGDNPHAVSIVKHLSEKLKEVNISID